MCGSGTTGLLPPPLCFLSFSGLVWMSNWGLVPDTAAFTSVLLISDRVSTGEANGSPSLAVLATAARRRRGCRPFFLYHRDERSRPGRRECPCRGGGAGHTTGPGAKPRAGGRIPA